MISSIFLLLQFLFGDWCLPLAVVALGQPGLVAAALPVGKLVPPALAVFLDESLLDRRRDEEVAVLEGGLFPQKFLVRLMLL
jgi:hypothetical protein